MAYKMSVIIPCYKATETLSKTLHSIAMQSISDEIEVVLVNDCDALYYGDIIARFYPDLHINYVCNPENRGCGGARNTGIRAAAAEYITFIDADDQFTNSLALEIMYNRIMAEKADMLFCYGELSRYIAAGAWKNGMENAFHFETKEELSEKLRKIAKPGDMVWLKASRGMRFEDISEAFYEET